MVNIAVVTMVYKDYWALGQWYRHYGALVGEENLFVLSHGNDPRHREICPRASVLNLPRWDLTDFDVRREFMLHDLQTYLLYQYDWVIRIDADELILSDPAFDTTLQDALDQAKGDTVFALGFDLVAHSEDAPLTDGSVFETRRQILRNQRYSKCIAARGKTIVFDHGFRKPTLMPTPKIYLPQGLYLIHLKFANREALKEVNTTRLKMAENGYADVWRFEASREEGTYALIESNEKVDFDSYMSAHYADAFRSVRPRNRRRNVRIFNKAPVRERSELPARLFETA